MSKKFLLIVEGKVTEKEILKSILEKCDIDVYKCDKIDLAMKVDELFLNIYDTSNKDVVYLVQGPRNRIHDWLKLMKSSEEDFERYFNDVQVSFAGIFIIYDVDHTSKEELVEMFDKYNDETDRGLLLLSSPCVEVLADPNRTEKLECNHLKEYKAQLNVKYNIDGFDSAENYIIKNFNGLILNFIDKNTTESGSNNVMEHPQFVLSKINDFNERIYMPDGTPYVLYRYFTTVIYVCIAYINGLAKEIDNVELVKNFFIEKMKENS